MPAASPGDVATASRTATRDRIERFAEVTGDDNPLHVDERYAGGGFFGEPVAHGMFAAGVVSSALASLDGDVIYVSQDLQFLAPVYVDQTVTATVEVSENLSGDRLRVETIAETDEETVVTGEAVILSLEREGGGRLPSR
ncbi:MaoC family dehydratase [Halovivax gelatinilyticus]|uniref:MaoC family dehydratase n=1 Tax=Halovivax gelatinilyticus TaxID=2961597 RepID=UPI0020CA2828|nr:MaoC family dehydratase [Halovivax gelatinilyticus]